MPGLGCGLDILSKLDAPLLTNVRFDGWRDEVFSEEWVDLLAAPIIVSYPDAHTTLPTLSYALR